MTTRRDGRRKLHFLNPVPIQLIADRWISRYAQPWTAAMVDLKSALEARDKEDSTHMGAPQHVFQVYIRATPERLWQAITDPAMTQIYYFGSIVDSDFAVGSPITYKQPDGSLDIDGKVLEADPPRKLVHSFTSRWEANEDPPSTVTWEITPMGSETCLLSVTHGGFPSENAPTTRSRTAGRSSCPASRPWSRPARSSGSRCRRRPRRLPDRSLRTDAMRRWPCGPGASVYPRT